MSRRGSPGQGSVELLAALPLLLLGALLIWQMAAVSWAALQAEGTVRERALRHEGAQPGQGQFTATVRVPALVPGVDGVVARSRASVRAPGR